VIVLEPRLQVYKAGCLHLFRFIGRLHDEPLDALWRQASEKRQGTKSRSGWGFAAARYWDLRRIKDWSLTSPKEKLIKIGAKFVSHGHYVVFQMADVAIPRQLFADVLRLVAELRPPGQSGEPPKCPHLKLSEPFTFYGESLAGFRPAPLHGIPIALSLPYFAGCSHQSSAQHGLHGSDDLVDCLPADLLVPCNFGLGEAVANKARTFS
jgi:hypothetical protein